MTPKRSDRKKEASDYESSLKTVRKLTRRARAELTELLMRNRGGDITRTELETGLKELRKRLKRILIHEYKL